MFINGMQLIGFGGRADPFSVVPGASSCTWNPSDKGTNLTLSGGNLTATGNYASMAVVRGTVKVTTGRYYYEVYITEPNGGYTQIGVAHADKDLNSSFGGIGWAAISDGTTSPNVMTLATFAANDIMQIAVDLDAGTMRVGKNGTWLNNNNPIFTGITGPIYPCIAIYSISNTTARFSSTSWSYPAPTGYTNFP